MEKGITQKQFDSIDFKKLDKIISEKIGYSIVLTYKLKESNHGGFGVTASSPNLKDKAGITSILYEELRLDTFGLGLITDDGSLWMPMHFSWTYKSFGGSNGTKLLTAWYDFDAKKWIERS